MPDSNEIQEILDLYRKHGWTLRRALLRSDLRQQLSSSAAQLFEHAAVTDSDINALWFSRRSKPGHETWELRYLSTSPFALLAVVPDGTPGDELESILSEIESQIKERVITPVTNS